MIESEYGNDNGFRWKAVLSYDVGGQSKQVTERFEEIEDLHDIIERGPDWNTLQVCTITLIARDATPEPQNGTSLEWGVVSVDADAFDKLESCLTNPAQPTQSIRDGAELIRKLYEQDGAGPLPSLAFPKQISP